MTTEAAKQCKETLSRLGNPEKAKILAKFFKTGKGEYGEGDVFLGVTVPQQRNTVKELYKKSGGWDFETIEELLKDPVHECRMAGWLGLIHKFRKEDEEGRRKCFEFASERLHLANNWDLVDVVMPTIIGEYLLDKDRSCLEEWAQSDCLWRQRTAMVCTWMFLKKKDSSTTLKLAKILVNHPHDLIRKAVGWMLREAAKRVSRREVTRFLGDHKETMPRVALRYAIERYPVAEKDWFMGRTEKEPSTLWDEGLC